MIMGLAYVKQRDFHKDTTACKQTISFYDSITPIDCLSSFNFPHLPLAFFFFLLSRGRVLKVKT